MKGQSVFCFMIFMTSQEFIMKFLERALLELIDKALISKLWSFVRCDFQWDSHVTERSEGGT